MHCIPHALNLAPLPSRAAQGVPRPEQPRLLPDRQPSGFQLGSRSFGSWSLHTREGWLGQPGLWQKGLHSSLTCIKGGKCFTGGTGFEPEHSVDPLCASCKSSSHIRKPFLTASQTALQARQTARAAQAPHVDLTPTCKPLHPLLQSSPSPSQSFFSNFFYHAVQRLLFLLVLLLFHPYFRMMCVGADDGDGVIVKEGVKELHLCVLPMIECVHGKAQFALLSRPPLLARVEGRHGLAWRGRGKWAWLGQVVGWAPCLKCDTL